MTSGSIKRVDELFKSYNYKVADSSTSKVRVYTLRYGMYNAAEIISFDENFNVNDIKREYSDLGFATDVKVLKSEDAIEEYLFEGFFIKTPLGNELKNRYRNFKKKQLQNLPEGSTYEYINSAYDLMYQDEDKHDIITKSYTGNETPIIEKINEYLTEVNGAILIIIEAAAGFGKTCTANEILNTFSPVECKKLPFFTELSRNREARVFKHILLNEIDEQFPAGIKQNIVIEQITKGRIPLIIDGFDELITKESNKEEVESMLTTIISLLKGNAKIILTSRKTAIFNSDEFLNSIYDSEDKFSLARIEIKEPTIKNWLDSERMKIIQDADFPVNQISNPVLLSYLRNIPVEKLKKYIEVSDRDSLIDKYVNYLLEREKTRQNLKLSNESQLRVFRKLMCLMTEYNFTAESKEMIKDFIKEFNLDLLQSSLESYSAEEKPSIEDLVETLSNHVFLDRKPNGSVGIINDFIFGHLVGENLLCENYQEDYCNYTSLIPESFASKSIEAFRVQSNERKQALWEIYNNGDFNYSTRFFFELDFFFLKKFKRKYENLFLSDSVISEVNFGGEGTFRSCTFSSLTFKDCIFDLDCFSETSFQNCKFWDCEYTTEKSDVNYSDFSLFACESNNDFVEKILELVNEEESTEETVKKELSEKDVLLHFFHIDGVKPRARKFAYIKKSLSNYSNKEISKVIDTLKSKEYLHFKDDVGFITREAIYYLKHNK